MHILSVLYRELGSYTILLHIPLALATSVRACAVVFFRRAPRRRVYTKQGRQTRPGAVTSKASKHWRCIRHSDLSGRPHHSLAARSRLVESDLTGMLPLRRDARARPIPRPACPGPQPGLQAVASSVRVGRCGGEKDAGRPAAASGSPGNLLSLSLLPFLRCSCLFASEQ